MKKIRCLLVALLVFSPFFRPEGGRACTLYGAAGSAVEGGGVLLGKIRDLDRNEEQFLRRDHPPSGIPYLGLASRKDRRVIAGVNARGLAIVNAAAASIRHRTHTHLPIEEVLGRAANIAGAIEILRREGMRSPMFYMLADLRSLALLEAYDRKRSAVREVQDGILIHANHYDLPSMAELNRDPFPSSAARLARIRSLTARPPFTPAQFVAFSQDHTNGPGRSSLCRHSPAAAVKAHRSVSAIIFRVREQNPPEIWLRVGQPCSGPFEKIPFA